MAKTCIHVTLDRNNYEFVEHVRRKKGLRSFSEAVREILYEAQHPELYGERR